MQAYETPVSMPFVEPNFSAHGLIQVTLRLAQILAQEVDLLDAMQVKEIAALQEEKLQLLGMLEAQKKVLQRKPELLDHLEEDERTELRQVVKLFEDIMQENHRRLRVARDVNEAIVGAIREAITEQHVRGLYSGRGMTQTSNAPISVTLNNMV